MGELWYERPASSWNEALPIGNGALGAMVFGGVEKEFIRLNEESLWYGQFRDRHNPVAKKALEPIRKLLGEGKVSEAEKYVAMGLFAVPNMQRHYSVLGDLTINYYNQGTTLKSYKRRLDLDQALCEVSYETEKAQFKREIFCSYVDEVMVIRLTSSEKRALELSVYLDRNEYVDEISFHKTGAALYGISGGKDGIAYYGAFEVKTKGGSIEQIGESIYVKGCEEVLIFISAATNFNNRDPSFVCKHILKAAKEKGYEVLLENHLKDYESLSQTMSLELKGEAFEGFSTEQRLKRVQAGKEDLGLINLYFQFGRYLLISCSRPGGLPANLQGIWNNDYQPPWGGKYTININTQMNYWPAEKCHLSSCHLPLFEHLERMLPHGEMTAKKMYGCQGFVAHHNTDIWGDTAPQDRWLPATIWPMGGAWLSLHIWEHYCYTKDMTFLKEKYHLLKAAGDFFKGYLVRDERGYLITGPSTSPENTYILPSGERGTVCMGPTMDHEILFELFTAIIEAGYLIGEDEAELATFTNLRKSLPPLTIGKYGQIMEWRYDYEEAEPGHRHISQLFALYPGHMIDTEKTPQLAEAAKKTLERRLQYGGGHTGWSRAWIINLWARLKEGDKAYENIKALLAQSTLINLLDNHPPFQIDGNFGGIAGIAEMLLQDQAGEVELLPALPKAWSEGKVKGICGRGGLEAVIKWQQGRLVQAVLKTKVEGWFTIKCQNLPLVLKAGEYESLEAKGIRLKMKPNCSYMILVNE